MNYNLILLIFKNSKISNLKRKNCPSKYSFEIFLDFIYSVFDNIKLSEY